jgi:hypothetical protein
MKRLLLALLLVGAAFADEPVAKLAELTADGKVYKDVIVTSVDALGIKITHSSGFARLSFDVLSDDLKERFGYDKTRAADAKTADDLAKLKAENQAAERRAAALKEATRQYQTLTLKVTLLTTGGLVCYRHTPGKPGAPASATSRLTGRSNTPAAVKTEHGAPLFVTGMGVLSPGEVRTVKAARDGVVKLDGQTLEHWIAK